MLSFTKCSLAIGSAFLAMCSQLDAQLSLKVKGPISGSQASLESSQVTIAITGTTDTTRLVVHLNGSDVSTRFHIASCTLDACEAVALLTRSDGLRAGDNKLGATLTTTHGGVAADVQRFHLISRGLSSSEVLTNSPNALSVTTSISGVHFSAYPGKQGGANYPQDFQSGLGVSPASACASGRFSVFVLDRSTLLPKDSNWSACFDPADNPAFTNFVRAYDGRSILIGYQVGPSAVPLSIDLRAIGGDNLSDPKAFQHFGVSIIGVPGITVGGAYESYSADATTFAPLDGVLQENTYVDGTSNYSFRQPDLPSFSITPGTSSNGFQASFHYGYRDVNFGNSTPPHYTLPPQGVTPVSRSNDDYCASPTGLPSGDGGVCVLLLDSHTLKPVAFTLFHTNQADTAQAMQEQRKLAVMLQQRTSVALVSTIGNALDASRGQALDPQLASTLEASGASQQDFDALLDHPNNTYSFVAAYDPDRFAPQVSVPKQPYATSLHASQAETGGLRGVLQRNHHNLFDIAQIQPALSEATLGTLDATKPDFVLQIGYARPAPWPLMDTNGHIAAYHALSYAVLVGLDGSTDETCTLLLCDIRANYENVAYSLSPLTLDDPQLLKYASSSAYTPSEFEDMRQQIKLELSYVQAVKGYFTNVVNSSIADQDTSVAASLTSAATTTANDMNTALGTPQAVNSASASLGPSALDILSGGLSLLTLIVAPEAEPFIDAAGVLIGMGATGWEAGLEGKDGLLPPKPDPYVTQLGTLLANGSNDASQAAIDYALLLTNASVALHSRIDADWYKLATFGSLIKTPPDQAPDAKGFYFQTLPQISQSFQDEMVLSARRSFALQVSRQFMGVETQLGWWNAGLPDPPRKNYVPFTYTTPFLRGCVSDVDRSAGEPYTYYYKYRYPSLNQYNTADFKPVLPIAQPYGYLPSPSSAAQMTANARDYYLIRSQQLINDTPATWSESFGAKLFGAPTSGVQALNQNLNLPKSWFLSTTVLPSIVTCTPGPQPDWDAGPNPMSLYYYNYVYQDPDKHKWGPDNPHYPYPPELDTLIKMQTATVVSQTPNAPSRLVATVSSNGSQFPSGWVTFSVPGQQDNKKLLSPSADPGTSTAIMTLPAAFTSSEAIAVVAQYTGSLVHEASQSTPVKVNGVSSSYMLSADAHPPSAGLTSASLTLTPLHGFVGQVNVSCTATGLAWDSPAATCIVNPKQVKLDGSESQIAGIQLRRTVLAGAAGRLRANRFGDMIIVACFLAPMLTVRKRQQASMLLGALVIALCGALVGCGVSNTSDHLYQVRVKAESGYQVRETEIQVRVRGE